MDLKLTNGSTERETVQEAYDLLKSLEDITVTTDNIDEARDEISDILWEASAITIGFQARTIKLIEAFS